MDILLLVIYIRMATKDGTRKYRRYTKPDPAVVNWKPATIIPPRPQICSSQFQGKKPFYPKYLQDKTKSDMYLLLSEEYRRMWFNELNEYYLNQVNKSNPIPNRPYLVRYRKPKTNVLENKKRFIMKRFQDVPARTDSGEHIAKKK